MKKQAYSAFLPCGEYIPDGEPRVFGERVYLYGSHDRFGSKSFCENDYALWSAPVDNLGDWRCEGEIYKRTQDPANHDGKYSMWAPDVVQGADGRYYLFYCLADRPQISVAVCDTPSGSFQFHGHVHDKNGAAIGKRHGDTIPFDPAVLTDDDGRILLYYGNGPMSKGLDRKKRKASMCVELYPDMITIKGEPKALIPTLHNSKGTSFEGHEFFEASSIRKFGETYYFIYSSVGAHELCYAMSKNPDSGFEYLGVLVSNGDIFPEDNVKIAFNSGANLSVKNYIGNNHGSIARINGRYYVFFHRHTNRNMFSRQACAEEIEITPDGHFNQARLTSCGLNGGPLEGNGTFETRIVCHLQSKKGALFSVHPMVQNRRHPALTQDGPDNDGNSTQYIENMRDGASAGFRYFDIGNVTNISAKIRGKGSGILLVQSDPKGAVLAEIPIAPSKAWSVSTAKLDINPGIHALYFTFEGKGAIDFHSFTMK